jgi:predicted HAD superfamily Cof-like phosphohydrolase
MSAPLREFMDAFDVERPQHPSRPDTDMIRLCLRLVKEECKEVEDELIQLRKDEGDTVAIQGTLGLLLKELCDLRYVVEHTAVACGLDLDAGAYAEVHRSNMSKLGPDGRPVRDEGGKIQKGPDYSPADMSKFIPPILDHEEV